MEKLLLLFLISFPSFGTELSPSLLMFHEWDFNQCPQRIKKILKLDTENIQVLITGYHRSNENKEILQYRYYSQSGNFINLNSEILKRFKSKIKACLKLIPNDIKIAITLHLNDSEKTAYWRNFVIFNPLEKKMGFSYYDFMIEPVVEILDELNKEKVSISLQGEMGATIFAHPLQYFGIIKKLKKLYPLWEYGISLNYNKINGGVMPKRRRDLQILLNEIDFFGFSAYQPFDSHNVFDHFQQTGPSFLELLKPFRVKIPRTTPLHFREVGLGGGSSFNNGWTPAETPTEAALHPYSGLYEPKNNPWVKPGMREFRIRYHKELLNFLKYSHTYTWNPVTEAYLWNTGSWDPLDLYKFSDTFADKEIIEMILKQ